MSEKSAKLNAYVGRSVNTLVREGQQDFLKVNKGL